MAPLVEAKVAESDVLAFWAAQPFDLALRRHEGNCDLCFLKGRAKRARVMRERPELAAWWIQQEDGPLVQLAAKPNGRRFRADGPTYAQQLAAVLAQPLLPGLDLDEDDVTPCACHD